MDLRQLYASIDLQPEIAGRLEELQSGFLPKGAEVYLEQLTRPETAAGAYRLLDACLSDDPDHLKMLYCQLECACRIFPTYQEMGIAESVFTDTMKCFSRFIAECGRRNGRLFFDRGWWTYRQISMSLFRIGALEYEFTRHEGKRVIGIHIPSDADFAESSVDRSLADAEAFFGAHFPDYPRDTWICDSWLLSGTLRMHLREGSNILSFGKRFTILQEDQEGECLEWLFQVPDHTPADRLPEHTALQRSVKRFLLDGGKIGTALGVLKEKPKTFF